ncbi:MAG: hypothetical protein QW228_03835 [Candidatus Aenigmatarchaeota archaeon]
MKRIAQRKIMIFLLITLFLLLISFTTSKILKDREIATKKDQTTTTVPKNESEVIEIGRRGRIKIVNSSNFEIEKES